MCCGRPVRAGCQRPSPRCARRSAWCRDQHRCDTCGQAPASRADQPSALAAPALRGGAQAVLGLVEGRGQWRGGGVGACRVLRAASSPERARQAAGTHSMVPNSTEAAATGMTTGITSTGKKICGGGGGGGGGGVGVGQGGWALPGEQRGGALLPCADCRVAPSCPRLARRRPQASCAKAFVGAGGLGLGCVTGRCPRLGRSSGWGVGSVRTHAAPPSSCSCRRWSRWPCCSTLRTTRAGGWAVSRLPWGGRHSSASPFCMGRARRGGAGKPNNTATGRIAAPQPPRHDPLASTAAIRRQFAGCDGLCGGLGFRDPNPAVRAGHGHARSSLLCSSLPVRPGRTRSAVGRQGRAH
jgi:hypothetical protein